MRYILTRSRKLFSNINLRVREQKVYVSAPFWVSKSTIDNFVRDKNDWINRALTKQKRSEVRKCYTSGERHLLFGQELPLKVKSSKSVIRTGVEVVGNQFILTIYSGYEGDKYLEEAERAFLSYYLERLTYYLTSRANYFTSQLGVEYSKIQIKEVSSIWGSCSPRNVLSFNRKLIQAPNGVIDYVVIHEVCHLIERNHSSRFWGQVRKLDINYIQNRSWLRHNHHLLTI